MDQVTNSKDSLGLTMGVAETDL